MPDGIDQRIREAADRSFIALLESPTFLQQFMEIVSSKQDWSKIIALANLMDIPEELRAYIPLWKTLFLPLHHTDPEELKESEAAFAQLLRAWQVCDAPEEKFAATLVDIASRLDALPDSDLSQWRRAMMFLYNFVLNKRPQEEREELSRVLSTHVGRHTEEWNGIVMTGAEDFMLRQDARSLSIAVRGTLCAFAMR